MSESGSFLGLWYGIARYPLIKLGSVVDIEETERIVGQHCASSLDLAQNLDVMHVNHHQSLGVINMKAMVSFAIRPLDPIMTLLNCPSIVQLTSSYQTLTTHYVPGPRSLSYFLPHFLLPLSLLASPSCLPQRATRTLIFPFCLASTVHAWYCMRGVDVISVDTLWWCIYFLVLKDPRREFERVVETAGKDGKGAVVTRQSFPEAFGWERGGWVAALLSERPLSSWKIGGEGRVCAPYVERRRGEFLRDVLWKVGVVGLVGMPVAVRLREYQGRRGRGGMVVSLLHAILPSWFLRRMVLGLYLYSLMTLMFLPPYLVPVLATHLFPNGAEATWSPHRWPRPHFGPFSSVLDDGLRGLWGKWWHQQMRHAVSEPGRVVAQALGLERKKGSWRGLGRYAIICASAFGLSGITHMGLVPPEPRGSQCWRVEAADCCVLLGAARGHHVGNAGRRAVPGAVLDQKQKSSQSSKTRLGPGLYGFCSQIPRGPFRGA